MSVPVRPRPAASQSKHNTKESIKSSTHNSIRYPCTNHMSDAITCPRPYVHVQIVSFVVHRACTVYLKFCTCWTSKAIIPGTGIASMYAHMLAHKVQSIKRSLTLSKLAISRRGGDRAIITKHVPSHFNQLTSNVHSCHEYRYPTQKITITSHKATYWTSNIRFTILL